VLARGSSLLERLLNGPVLCFNILPVPFLRHGLLATASDHAHLLQKHGPVLLPGGVRRDACDSIMRMQWLSEQSAFMSTYPSNDGEL
jgi:hypothetical protein